MKKLIRRFFRRKQRATLVFTSHLGSKVEVGTVVCPKCTNYFFAPHLQFERPAFCCYCGLKFEGFVVKSTVDIEEDL